MDDINPDAFLQSIVIEPKAPSSQSASFFDLDESRLEHLEKPRDLEEDEFIGRILKQRRLDLEAATQPNAHEKGTTEAKSPNKTDVPNPGTKGDEGAAEDELDETNPSELDAQHLFGEGEESSQVKEIFDPVEPPPRYVPRSFLCGQYKAPVWDLSNDTIADLANLPTLTQNEDPANLKMVALTQGCRYFQRKSQKIPPKLCKFIFYSTLFDECDEVSHLSLTTWKTSKKEDGLSWVPSWKVFSFCLHNFGCQIKDNGTSTKSESQMDDAPFTNVSDTKPCELFQPPGSSSSKKRLTRLGFLFECLNLSLKDWQMSTDMIGQIAGLVFSVHFDPDIALIYPKTQDILKTILDLSVDSKPSRDAIIDILISSSTNTRERIFLFQCLPSSPQYSNFRAETVQRLFNLVKKSDSTTQIYVHERILEELEAHQTENDIDYNHLYDLLDILSVTLEFIPKDTDSSHADGFGKRLCRVLNILSQHRKRSPRALHLKELALVLISLLPAYLQNLVEDDGFFSSL